VEPLATASAAGALRVAELGDEPADAIRWNAYIHRHPQASFFHRAEWKAVIESAFGHRSYFLLAERAGGIVGVLPLGHIRSRLFGNALISAPFCVYGGVLADDAAVEQSLRTHAADLARRLGVGHLELRHRMRHESDWARKALYFTFRKSIDPDPEQNMLAIPRKQRAMVRKGIKAGLTSEIDERVDRFYQLYATSVRNLGTPVFSRRYAEILKRSFGADCEVLTVVHENRPVSSVMSFYFRDEVLPYYGGGGSDARAVAGNDFMYWELMRRAAERGLRTFDYGRSKEGTGSYSFKKNWGFEPEPMHYEYLLIRAKSVPDINPLNPKYRLFINLWRHLPLGVSKAIGPVLARNLG
jgi:FemAB-related protein (PEP-CTERM system-associated)